MTTPPLEDPGKELAAALRTAVLAAAKLGELYARRRELLLRRELAAGGSSGRDIQRRINAERKLAEDRLRAMRGTMRTLASITPATIADVYRDAVAWRDQLPMAKEVAESVETYMRGFGMDPAQLQAAGKEFARRAEPTARPGLALGITDTDIARANTSDATAVAQLAAEHDRIRPATLDGLTAHLGPERMREVRAALDQADMAAARAVYERHQGLTGTEALTPAMLADWRAAEATRWAVNNQAADLALFAALILDSDSNDDASDKPSARMTDLWLAWRAREREGLAHPDLAQLSGLAFAAQLDRAHEWVSDFDPDGYDEWRRMRSIDPRRADMALVHRYEVEQATQWAAEIGDDLWKHGFARTAAQHPDDGLDQIARRVWVAAGKPAPTWDPDVSAPPLEQRWAAQVQAATRVQQQDPDLWRDWQDWHSDPNRPPTETTARDADMVADYHHMQAETWASEAREARTLAESVPTRTPGQLLAAWRSHTAGQHVLTAESDTEQEVFDRAQSWLQTRDPIAYMAFHAHLTAIPESERASARAELVRDYETHEARRWAEALETLGAVAPGTAARDADDLIKMWRSYTSTLNKQGPQQQSNTGAQGQTANTGAGAGQPRRGGQKAARSQQARAGRPAGPQPQTPTLASLVQGRVPDWVISRPGWRQSVETTFRGLVSAGVDPQVLADAVADLRFADARDATRLSIWKMRRTAGQGHGVESADQNAAGAVDDVVNQILASRRGGRHSPGDIAAFEARLAGMDPADAQALRIVYRAFATAPDSAVQSASHTTPASAGPQMGSPHRSHEQGR
ncbi:MULTISPECIES: hypothetical protein [Nocardia]|uniref:hypothetical protein n=1 Tax=Nocardia TaxID=1817 RepID=UPI002455162C|nr:MULTISPECIES: hypothetical protein [Nocardia]